MTKREHLMNYVAEKKSMCIANDTIADELFTQYGVNRGLRDLSGKGVLTGLTNISEVVSFKEAGEGNRVPCDGELWYRGYNVKTLIGGLGPEEFGFEKTAYLLMFGQLPDEKELAEFRQILSEFYERCHHEGSDEGYHEFYDAKHTDACGIR